MPHFNRVLTVPNWLWFLSGDYDVKTQIFTHKADHSSGQLSLSLFSQSCF